MLLIVSFSRRTVPYCDLFIQTANDSEHGLIRRRTPVYFRCPLFCRHACVFLLRFSIYLNFPRYSMSTRVPFALLVFLILSRYFVSTHFIFSFVCLYSFVTSNLKSADRRVFFVIPSDKLHHKCSFCLRVQNFVL
jgi:hypothetical protein